MALTISAMKAFMRKVREQRKALNNLKPLVPPDPRQPEIDFGEQWSDGEAALRDSIIRANSAAKKAKTAKAGK